MTSFIDEKLREVHLVLQAMSEQLSALAAARAPPLPPMGRDNPDDIPIHNDQQQHWESSPRPPSEERTLRECYDVLEEYLGVSTTSIRGAVAQSLEVRAAPSHPRGTIHLMT